jgi:hypothetical protein
MSTKLLSSFHKLLFIFSMFCINYNYVLMRIIQPYTYDIENELIPKKLKSIKHLMD